jgi:hypothetical protein
LALARCWGLSSGSCSCAACASGLDMLWDITALRQARRQLRSPLRRPPLPMRSHCRGTGRSPSLRRTRKLRCRRDRRKATARRRPLAMETRIQRQISRARRLSGRVRLQVRLRPRHQLPHRLRRQRQCGRRFRRLEVDRPAGHRQLRRRLLLPQPLPRLFIRRWQEPQVNSWCRLPRYRTLTMPECW